jgi:hypothetical protein
MAAGIAFEADESVGKHSALHERLELAGDVSWEIAALGFARLGKRAPVIADNAVKEAVLGPARLVHGAAGDAS